MNLSSRNLKLIIGVFYLLILFFGLYYLFSLIDIRDLTSYEFIKSNKEIIINYKNNNFLFLTIIFFLLSLSSRKLSMCSCDVCFSALLMQIVLNCFGFVFIYSIFSNCFSNINFFSFGNFVVKLSILLQENLSAVSLFKKQQ